MAQAVRSLSPKRIAERTQQHRQAVMLFARLAAKRAVQDEMRAQGVRVTLVFPATITEKAREYLDTHPELYQLALERAHKLGYIDPLSASQDKLTNHKHPIHRHFGCAKLMHRMEG
jgi:hypothetical protein